MNRKYPTTHITLSPAEALIIEYSLKSREGGYENYQEFLVKIMHCIVTNQSRTIEVDEGTLWLLRNEIDYRMNIGSVTGGVVLSKVYVALLSLRPMPFTIEPLDIIEPGQPSTALIIREEEDV